MVAGASKEEPVQALRSSGTSVLSPPALESCLKGPRTQIIGFQGPNTILSMLFGLCSPVIWVLGPLGLSSILTLDEFAASVSSSLSRSVERSAQVWEITAQNLLV